MKLEEYLKDKENHSHCAYCAHIFLLAPLFARGAESFDAMNTIIHMITCHPEEFTADTELVKEVKEWIDVEL